MAEVIAVCLCENRGATKFEMPEISLRKDFGIEGDGHAGNWHRQVSLLDESSVDKIRNLQEDVHPGTFAENIRTRGIILCELPIGTWLRVGETLLEVTQIGKPLGEASVVLKQPGGFIMPREGIYAVVLEGGAVRPGDPIDIVG